MQPLQSLSPGWIRAGVYRNGRVNTMFTNASYKSRTAPSLGKEGCSSITLLVTRAAELNIGKDWGLRKSRESETRWEWEALVLTCLSDAAAEGHIST